jgi:hypothetical protein
LGHGEELGMMVKRKAKYISAEITVSFGEKKMLMPYLVDDL